MKIEIYCKYNKQTYPAIDMRNFTPTNRLKIKDLYRIIKDKSDEEGTDEQTKVITNVIEF